MEPTPSVSDSLQIFMRRRELFDIMKSSECPTLENQIEYLKKHIGERTNCPLEFLYDLHRTLSRFTSEFKKRWNAANRKCDKFLSNNSIWLESSIGFLNYKEQSSSHRGRHTKSFSESRDRTKRQKTLNLRAKFSAEELTYATQMSLRASGHVEASKLIKEISLSLNEAAKYRLALQKSQEGDIIRVSAEETLSMIVEAKRTRHQYNIIRAKDKLKFPSCKVVQKAKTRCYPKKECIAITSNGAEVQLQALLDHTISRLLQVQEEVISSQEPNVLENLVLLSKWGFDGSSGQSEYKQVFDNEEQRDANIFLSSLVPLQLVFEDDNSKEKIILWQNPRPSSTRFCRPIKFMFAHESTQLVQEQQKYIKNRISELKPFHCAKNEKNIQVTHRLLFTMIDGKICNSVTGTKSTQKCYICGLSSKDFNDLEKVFSTDINIFNLQFGISILHGWIRFFECLLHLSYKLPLLKWQARGEEDKAIVADRKRKIQSEFKTQLGLLVDKPKPGFGSTNDGNTARRFFANYDISANITEIDVDIMQRFYIIMQTISSTFEININKFEKYAHETAKMFVDKYSWYPMPPSVHKILCHGPQIIKHALLPIGQLSEEAQEARNKDFKKYREWFSRKISRQKTNEDIFNLLLVSSDPLISSFMQRSQRKQRKFDPEVLDMLEPPDISQQSSKTSTAESPESQESSDESSD